jgi:ribonuclease P protein component
MAANKPFSLGKSERLKSRKQIDALFESGKKLTVFPFRLLYQKEPGNRGLKAGFTVSSKTFPRAVDRNRLKRLTREAYRLQKMELQSLVLKNDFSLHLFIIYTGRDIIDYEEIATRLKQALDKLTRILHEDNSSNT